MRKYVSLAIFVTLLLFIAFPDIVSAAGGVTLSWDNPLQKLSQNISGPMALSIGVLAIAAGGLTIAFRPELLLFVAGFFVIVIILAGVTFAPQIIKALGITAAAIGVM